VLLGLCESCIGVFSEGHAVALSAVLEEGASTRIIISEVLAALTLELGTSSKPLFTAAFSAVLELGASCKDVLSE